MQSANASYGDIIYVKHFGYEHYGIYSGNGNVIHYVKRDDGSYSKGVIEETSLLEFLNGSSKYYIDNIKGKCYSPNETVKRARKCIGEGNYNLVFFNCQHFAMWCKTGIPDSPQVESKLDDALDFIISIITKRF